VLDDPGHSGGLAGTGAASQHNLSDFIGNLISHRLVSIIVVKKKAKDTHNLPLLQPFHGKKIKNQAGKRPIKDIPRLSIMK
jgi:hypothetical protein